MLFYGIYTYSTILWVSSYTNCSFSVFNSKERLKNYSLIFRPSQLCDFIDSISLDLTPQSGYLEAYDITWTPVSRLSGSNLLFTFNLTLKPFLICAIQYQIHLKEVIFRSIFGSGRVLWKSWLHKVAFSLHVSRNESFSLFQSPWEELVVPIQQQHSSVRKKDSIWEWQFRFSSKFKKCSIAENDTMLPENISRIRGLDET